jgi:hypothetical protein
MPELDMANSVESPVRHVIANAFASDHVTIRYRNSEGYSVCFEDLTFEQVMRLAALVGARV